MDSRLNGLHALITGASGGIGSATARALAKEGVNLTLQYKKNKESAEALAEELTDVKTLVMGAHLSDETLVRNLFNTAQEEIGRIDILIANAGVWDEPFVPIHKMSLAQWNKTVSNNLTSTFLSCQNFFQNLETHQMDHANLIIVGSTAAIFGEAGHVDYAATKAGIVYGMVRSLKNEIITLAKKGRVNAVCPGWTRTPMAAEALKDPEQMQHALQTTPLRKIAEPEDVASMITFLCSNNLAGHISGEIITVAGGMEGRVLFPLTSEEEKNEE